jgi:2-phosphosulfolactate phosphatase
MEEARCAEADFRIGERGSVKVEGFDFGNSPTEVSAASIEPGSRVALSTTNGTRVIGAAAGAPNIFTGAFVNATAVADELVRMESCEEVVVVGCGWEGHRASEDEAAAGAILHRLHLRGSKLDERARRVVDAYLGRSWNDLRVNSAARRLKRVGYGADLDFCLSEDTHAAAPMLLDGIFVDRRK